MPMGGYERWKEVSAFLVLVITTWFILWPSLRLPFSLIDDPNFAIKARSVSDALGNGNVAKLARAFFETNPGVREGRLGILFWTHFIIRFLVSDYNPFIIHFLQGVLITCDVLLVYGLVKKFSGSTLAGFMAGIIFIILSPGFENWYRISTQEPLQTFFLLLLILLIKIRRFNWMHVLVAGLLLFTKEVSILLLPAFIIWYKFETDSRTKKNLVGVVKSLFMISLILIGCLWLVARIFSAWSAGNVSLANVLPNLIGYWRELRRLFVLQLIGLSLLPQIAKLTDKNLAGYFRSAWIFLVLFIFSIFSLLPWRFGLMRLTFTAMASLAIFLGIQVSIWGLWLRREVFKKIWLFAVLAPLSLIITLKFTYVNFISIFDLASDYLAREETNGDMMKYFSALPYGAEVIINIDDKDPDGREWVEMMPKYLNVFYDRRDIRVKFIESDDFKQEPGIYYASWSYLQELEESGFKNQIAQFSRPAMIIKVSLRSLLKNFGRLNPANNFSTREYAWQVYRI